MTQTRPFQLTGSLVILGLALACGVVALITANRSTEPITASGFFHQVGLALPSADEPAADESTFNKRKSKVDDPKKKSDEVQYNKLSVDEVRILLHKGTERAFVGEYTDLKDPGTYVCKRCNAALYRSDDKFESHCGWPSFDDEIEGSVKRRRETDGSGRIEIVCDNCGGHLGHVFLREGYTAKNTRHCVNSLSMRFIAKGKPLPEVIKPKDLKDKSALDKATGEKVNPVKLGSGKQGPDKLGNEGTAGDVTSEPTTPNKSPQQP